MKKFIVDTGDKKYKVEANTYDEAISAVKAIQLKDEASPLQTVNALLEDERAAVDAYNVALENLKGKIPDESYAAIEAIRNDENRHIENLQAVVNGNVTEKNLEDSVKDAYGYVEIHNTGEQRDFGLKFGLKLQKQIDWKNWRRVEVLTEAAAKEIERAGYTVNRY